MSILKMKCQETKKIEDHPGYMKKYMDEKNNVTTTDIYSPELSSSLSAYPSQSSSLSSSPSSSSSSSSSSPSSAASSFFSTLQHHDIWQIKAVVAGDMKNESNAMNELTSIQEIIPKLIYEVNQ